MVRRPPVWWAPVARTPSCASSNRISADRSLVGRLHRPGGAGLRPKRTAPKLGRMKVIRPGDVGEPVRDVQHRLIALGHRIDPTELDGSFGPTTQAAIRAFQQQRGLPTDGLVGTATWGELVEAGWRLGDRTLYLRSPYFRGDDVRDLQRRLNALGFDTGREDGIFGERTGTAVVEFQRNMAGGADRVVGPHNPGPPQRPPPPPPVAGSPSSSFRSWSTSVSATRAPTRWRCPSCARRRCPPSRSNRSAGTTPTARGSTTRASPLPSPVPSSGGSRDCSGSARSPNPRAPAAPRPRSAGAPSPGGRARAPAPTRWPSWPGRPRTE